MSTVRNDTLNLILAEKNDTILRTIEEQSFSDINREK